MRRSARRLSRGLSWAFTAFMAALPLLAVVYFWNLEWMLARKDVMNMLPAGVLQVLPLLGPVTLKTKLICLAAVAAPTALTCVLLRRLALLFNGYARGEVFTLQSVRYIRQVGVLLLVREALEPFSGAVLALGLTVNNPPGHHMVTLGLSGSDLTQIVTGLALIVAAGVMDQGRRLHEDALLTI